MALDDSEKRKIARAIWAYTRKSQPQFESELGWPKHRLRSMLGTGKHAPPSTDELLAMAEVAGVPRTVVLDGWEVADPVAQLQHEVSDLDGRLASLAGDVLRHSQEIQELRDTGHRTGSSGGGAQ